MLSFSFAFATYLRLTADHNEDQHSLQRIDEVRHVPEVSRSAHRPGEHVRHPRDAHHHHQLQAHAAKSGATNKGIIVLEMTFVHLVYDFYSQSLGQSHNTKPLLIRKCPFKNPKTYLSLMCICN